MGGNLIIFFTATAMDLPIDVISPPQKAIGALNAHGRSGISVGVGNENSKKYQQKNPFS